MMGRDQVLFYFVFLMVLGIELRASYIQVKFSTRSYTPSLNQRHFLHSIPHLGASTTHTGENNTSTNKVTKSFRKFCKARVLRSVPREASTWIHQPEGGRHWVFERTPVTPAG